jgi:SAM-dependent methyltransferase
LPSQKKAKVLDFGGGDGRLMHDFLTNGCKCSLVDYSTQSLPGIDRLGDTLKDIPKDFKFDLIICSHVIEHVADPRQVILELKQYLDKDGALYVEVPMEIWGRAPLHEEPVTHINFFVPTSTRLLLERAGLYVMDCGLGGYRHPSGQWNLVVRSISRLNTSGNQASGQKVFYDTESFLNPSILLKLKRRMLIPASIPSALAYKIKKLIWSR